jgi:hypothetical protein
MRTALVTTTIYVPHVLAHFRRLGPDVAIYVAGDRRTPHDDVRAFLEGLGNAVYLSDAEQEAAGYQCSEPIGWNTIPRRNVALLEALRDGADVVLTVDDDNIPVDEAYFDDLRELFAGPRPRLTATSEDGWFNVGEFLDPPGFHRGFPHELRSAPPSVRLVGDPDVLVGVAAGVVLGDPDIDAVDRIALRPTVRQASDVLRGGLAVDAGVFAPFNSQNTAALRALAPLLMVLPGVGRHQDIWASFIAQRLMAGTPYRLHYGKPFVWQERTSQSLWGNLREELLGLEVGGRIVDDLRRVELEGASLTADLRRVFEAMRTWEYVPEQTWRFGLAWCSDLESIGEW